MNHVNELDAVILDGPYRLPSTLRDHAAAGGVGADGDVGRFIVNFGSSTSGAAALLLNLTARGIASGEDLCGLSFN